MAVCREPSQRKGRSSSRWPIEGNSPGFQITDRYELAKYFMGELPIMKLEFI
jgi:hypothetical protein